MDLSAEQRIPVAAPDEGTSDPLSNQQVFQESPDFPGYIRVVIVSIEDIKVRVCINRKQLLKQLLQDEEDKKSGKGEDITEMYDLTYLTFQKDLNQHGAYRLNWSRPNKSLMIVDITNLKVLGSPTRITHYSNAALKPLKEQMRALAFEERERSNSDATPNAAARAGRRINRRRSSPATKL